MLAPRRQLRRKPLGDKARHGVVDGASGQNDVRLVADRLGLVGEVERVDADAVAADQAGLEVEEVPLGARGVEHVVHRQAEALADHRHFIDERDVDVALGVLDRLGCLGGADVARHEHLAAGDPPVHRRQPFRRGLGLSGDDLGHPLDGMLPVSRVDALGRVAEEEVDAAA